MLRPSIDSERFSFRPIVPTWMLNAG